MAHMETCPFCDAKELTSTSRLSLSYQIPQISNNLCWVQCLKCGAQGPPTEDTRGQAEFAWNKRAGPLAAANATIAKLRMDLKRAEAELRSRERTCAMLSGADQKYLSVSVAVQDAARRFGWQPPPGVFSVEADKTAIDFLVNCILRKDEATAHQKKLQEKIAELAALVAEPGWEGR